MILYEYPFNERVRSYLRLEHLFGRLRKLSERSDPVDHHFALLTLFELFDVLLHSDVQTELLRDLERQRVQFEQLRGNPDVSAPALEQLLDQLSGWQQRLLAQGQQINQCQTSDLLLAALKRRLTIPGGTCSFDLPIYHDWLHRPVDVRRRQLTEWIAPLQALQEPMAMLLQVLRDNGTPQKMLARGGLLQQSLPAERQFQLMRLRLSPQYQLIPEISGHRLMYMIRLLERGADGHMHPCTHSHVELELTLCA